MPVIIDGTNGVNTPNTFAFKNRIIDGGFTINQRGYTSGTSLSSGSYGHDRWKGGASGGTYTFTQGSTGVNTTITITAGSIIQVIEGANLPEGGTYVLSWTGTAQGKIGAGSFGASGITGTITAGTNTNIEFNTGTCGNVQLEVGSTATSFDYRPYTTELQLCQRYLPAWNGSQPISNAFFYGTTDVGANIPFPVTTRVAPTGITISSASHFRFDTSAGFTPSAISFNSAGLNNGLIIATVSGATNNAAGRFLATNASAQLLFTGCEL